MDIELGPNKVVTLSPWNAKTKKEFVKIFKLKQEKVSEQDILNTLVYPYIDKTDIYYSAAELQYLLAQLRKLSIDKKIEFSIDCDKCKEEVDVSLDIDEIVTYTPNQFPSQLNNVGWKDIEGKDSIKAFSKQFPEETEYDIAKILHISDYQGTRIERFEQMLEILENLPLQEDAELDDTYYDVISKIKIGSKIKCTSCAFEKNYEFDIIPSFFDPLLPKK